VIATAVKRRVSLGEQKKARKRKRPDGDGSNCYSEFKKVWIGRVMVGYRPDGKPDVREVAAKHQAEY
jgi:hypothetical protein